MTILEIVGKILQIFAVTSLGVLVIQIAHYLILGYFFGRKVSVALFVITLIFSMYLAYRDMK